MRRQWVDYRYKKDSVKLELEPFDDEHIDFEEEEVIAYMSDGEIIKVTKALFITSNKIAKA